MKVFRRKKNIFYIFDENMLKNNDEILPKKLKLFVKSKYFQFIY